MPGRPLGRPAVIPTRWPGEHQPSSTTRARGVGDQRLGDLVAPHRRGLHAPHQPAAADRLAAGRQRVDRHVRAVRGDQARRAARQRRHDERVEAQLARGDAGAVGDACTPDRARRGARASRSSARRARSRSVRTAIAAIISIAPTGCAPTAVSCESITASVPSRIALATSATSARVGREEVTIESSICVAVIDGRASEPASAISCFCTIGTCSIGSSMPRSPRATITQSATRRISSARSTACGFSILAISGSARVLAHGRDVLGAAHEATARRGRRRSASRRADARGPPRARRAASSVSPGMFSPWREATVPPISTSASISPSPAASRSPAGAPSRRRGR